ncbi:MAG: amidohydrolase [Bacteroidota bacterium]
MPRIRFLTLLLFLCSIQVASGQELDRSIESALPSLLETYRSLHAKPEISYYEEKTSSFMAKELRSLGFTVTERVGNYGVPNRTCYGVVAVRKNGTGPTVMVRTDLDGLPMEEKTGLPYASTVRTKNETGEEVGAMHACGHDIHMTSLLGTARMLVQLKDRWQGTLVMIGQPAEERGAGAKAMLNDGLYSRFPKPDFAIALHDNATLEAGKVGVTEGFALASVNSVDMTVRGVGGHGAYPHTTKDPVVIASEIVLALQTIVSREVSPLEPAVVTVGAIHGGTKHNIIPDEVHLQLTVRAYKEPVRRTILAAIKRIAEGIARSAGVPEDRLPIVRIDENEFTPSTYNDPLLTSRLRTTFEAALGKDNVVTVDPVMGGEDFGRFGLDGKVPACIFWLGAVDPKKVEESAATGTPLPSLHSSQFTPLPEPTIRTGVKAMTSAVLELMKK